jgi:hypothetical protein
MPDPTSLLEIGARLAVTRKALGLTQAEMHRMMARPTPTDKPATPTRPAANAFPPTTRSRYAEPVALALIGFIAGRCTACSLTSAPKSRPS